MEDKTVMRIKAVMDFKKLKPPQRERILGIVKEVLSPCNGWCGQCTYKQYAKLRSLGVSTIRQMVRDGELPPSKTNGKRIVRICPDHSFEWNKTFEDLREAVSQDICFEVEDGLIVGICHQPSSPGCDLLGRYDSTKAPSALSREYWMFLNTEMNRIKREMISRNVPTNHLHQRVSIEMLSLHSTHLDRQKGRKMHLPLNGYHN